MMVVNAAAAEGTTNIVTLHDSFGCLASQAKRFRRIIREQFVRMYEENDVLTQILDRAKDDLKRNPAAIKKLARLEKEYEMILGSAKASDPGRLDLKGVLARFGRAILIRPTVARGPEKQPLRCPGHERANCQN